MLTSSIGYGQAGQGVSIPLISGLHADVFYVRGSTDKRLSQSL